MSEVLVKKELASRPRELGAVACAGCPFAELGCPKQGTGDCPPAEVIKAKQATALLENKDVGIVRATEGGYEGVLEKPKERLAKSTFVPFVAMPSEVKPREKIEKPKPVERPKPPRRRGQSLGELAALMLLPARKTS